MPSKSFESKLYDWAKEHAQELGDDAYNKIIAILEKEAPEALEVKRRGRKNATTDEEEIISIGEFKGFLFSEDLASIMFDGVPDTAKDWAKLAIVLMEMGLIKSEGDNKTRFDVPTRSVYEIIKQYKDYEPKENGKAPITERAFRYALEEIEYDKGLFPEKEREEMKIIIRDIIKEWEYDAQDYYDQIGYFDGDKDNEDDYYSYLNSLY